MLKLKYFLPLLIIFPAILVAEDADWQSSANENYILQCQGCHRPDGKGIQEIVPDLRELGLKSLLLPQGREFFVAVPGSANSPLSDRQLAEVLNHIIVSILGSQSSDVDVPLFNTQEVETYRSRKISDVEGSREQLLLLMQSP